VAGEAARADEMSSGPPVTIISTLVTASAKISAKTLSA
jgi:hypothetical protein